MMSDEIVNGSSALEPIPEWDPPNRGTLPEYPTVRIVFTGLLSFCHNNRPPRGDCEVGVHNASDHFLQVTVWEGTEPGPNCVWKLVTDWKGHAATITDQNYFVYRRGSALPVGFYQPIPTFNRESSDPNDFRWIVDLENSEFYGYRDGRRTLPKVGQIVKPRVRFNTGQFYTAWRTSCEFQRQDIHAGSIVRMGKIASYLGVNIQLGPSDSAVVSLPGYSNPMISAEKQYRVFFRNTCDRPDCVNPDSSDPREQNDFFHHLATFTRNVGEPSFYLMPQGPPCTGTYVPTNTQLGLPPTPKLNLKDERVSDRAPCASAGFGGGGGLG